MNSGLIYLITSVIQLVCIPTNKHTVLLQVQSRFSPFTFVSRVEDHKLMQLVCSWSRLSRKLSSAKWGKGNSNKVITNSFRYILYQKAGLLNYFQEFFLAYLLNFLENFYTLLANKEGFTSASFILGFFVLQ